MKFLLALFAALLAVGCSDTEKTAALPDAGSATPGATPNNIEWMSEPLTDYGGWRIDGRYYYTQDGAIAAAKQVGGGWRLPTKEEFVALAALGSTWVEEGPWGLPGRWFGGNHDTDHRGSLFFEASGLYSTSSGGVNFLGMVGHSWSSSSYSSSRALGSNLDFGSSYVDPEEYSNRACGFPVRLVRDVQ